MRGKITAIWFALLYFGSHCIRTIYNLNQTHEASPVSGISTHLEGNKHDLRRSSSDKLSSYSRLLPKLVSVEWGDGGGSYLAIHMLQPLEPQVGDNSRGAVIHWEDVYSELLRCCCHNLGRGEERAKKTPSSFTDI